MVFLSLTLAYGQGSRELYQAYEAAKTQPDPFHRDSSQVRAYAAFAIYQINDKDPDAERYLDTLRQLTAFSAWPKSYGIMMRVQGRYFDVQGDMDAALNYYNQAIDTLRHTGPNYEDLSTALIGAGFVLLNTGLYDQSFQTLKEGYQYARVSGIVKNQWITLNFFGDYYYYSAFRQENYDSALYYYLKADTLIQAHQLGGYYQADNDLGLADVYRRLGKKTLSENYFQRSLKVAEANNNYGVIYALHIDKAEVLENQGKLEEALEMKLKAYEYVQQSGWIEFIARADQQLYQSFRSAGDYRNALKHYERYIAAQDSMKKDAAAARYAELEAKYESEHKEQQITQLENKNLIQSRNYLILVLTLGALLIGAIAWNNRNLRKKNKELKKKNHEILMAQLKGQNLERRRMATELHDNLNTKIAAIRWQLEAVAPIAGEKVKKVLDHTLRLIQDVYGDVRLISHNLMPEKVEAIGLIPALENLITQLKQNNRVHFHLVNNTGPELEIGSLTYPLYNIIFEMINNILKHAEAENGWISISEDPDHLLITVSDDGKGFDIDQMTNGYGIRNITSRLENIQGKWNIDSAPGKGTRFFMEIPKIAQEFLEPR